MTTKHKAKSIGLLRPPGPRFKGPQPLKLAKAKPKRAAVIFVAVVVREGFAAYPYSTKYASNRDDDGWFALMGENKEKLIEEALTKARSFGRYEVALGRLDEMVVTPLNFKVVKL